MLKDLTEGSTIKTQIFIKRIEEKNGKRGPYTSVLFTDGKSEYSANIWCPAAQFPYQGEVVDAEISMRNGYININNAVKVFGADLTKYIARAPVDEPKCFQMVCNAIQKIIDPNLRAVTENIILENADAFRKWSAAKSAHHNYLNGLLYHVCRMLAGVKTISAVYGLDEGLLTAGVILHDIGKLFELETDDMGVSDFTKEGYLFGHLYIGAVMVDNACTKLGIDKKDEKIILLKHMILSHHDQPQYGAVKMPATKEAYALSVLDLLDSKMWMFEKECGQLKEGAFSESIGILDGRHIYRPIIN